MPTGAPGLPESSWLGAWGRGIIAASDSFEKKVVDDKDSDVPGIRIAANLIELAFCGRRGREVPGGSKRANPSARSELVSEGSGAAEAARAEDRGLDRVGANRGPQAGRTGRDDFARGRPLYAPSFYRDKDRQRIAAKRIRKSPMRGSRRRPESGRGVSVDYRLLGRYDCRFDDTEHQVERLQNQLADRRS